MRGAAQGACPISAGTTNAIPQPYRSNAAVATRNGAQEDVRSLEDAPGSPPSGWLASMRRVACHRVIRPG